MHKRKIHQWKFWKATKKNEEDLYDKSVLKILVTI